VNVSDKKHNRDLYWRQFSLWHLFALVALVACLIGLVRLAIQGATYAAAQSSYGGRRYTREEAESIRGENSDFLSDSEFLERK
jgi:hypothetical protein